LAGEFVGRKMWQTVAFAKLKSLSFSRVSDRTLGTFVEVPLLRFGHEIFGGVLLLRMRKTQVLPKSPANPIHGKKENQNLENQVLRKNALEAQVNSNSNNDDDDNDNMYTCMYIIVYIYY
jgi:hypothetical protein